MKNKTLLLVEDNADDVDLTLRSFRKSNMTAEVVVARNGVEALDYIFGTGAYEGRDMGAAPAVILLDLKMPKLSGVEVLRRLQQDPRTRLIPVVVLSSSNEEKDKMECYQLGANSYIRKSVDFNQFSETIRSLGHYWLVLNEAPPLKDVKPAETSAGAAGHREGNNVVV
jgi:two-component system, response regulator